MADLKLPQNPLRENLFKKLITRLVLLAFLNQNLAFATNINLDFKDSQTPQRLHVIPHLSNVGDVSHVEINTEKRQASVYRVDATQLTEEENVSSLVHPDAIKGHPVIVLAHEIQNLPWDLEPEQLTLFILNHTAWLSPLEEDGYKLEFKGRLLGGMKQSGRGTYPHTINIYPGSVDCGGRNDWPKGTIGERFCNKNGNGSGGSGITVINVSGTGRGGSSQGTSSGWQGILGQGWAKIKENGDKARDRMQQQQENLKKLNTANQPWEIYKRPEIIIPESPFPRVQPYQPSTKESFQTGSSLEDQYSRLRVLYNMADSWEWWSIYEYAKAIGVSREEIKKYNLTQRHAKRAGFSLEYFKEVTEEEERNALKKKQQEEADREASHAGSSLYEVNPDYFERSSSDAGMRPSEAFNIIVNPTAENFYDRTILTSRQNWLGGSENTVAFVFEDLTNKQAYKYLSQGYHKGDFPTLSDRLVSQNGAGLFENVKPGDFVKQAKAANMTSIRALGILVNPTPENFYDRVMFTSRQNWLGSAQDTTAFLLEGLTNEEAYKYISQGYHKGDTTTISHKLISERWDIDTDNPFDDQVVKDWGAKDWREAVQLIPVGKMQKTDPMAPHDYFDLEGKMGGSGIMAGGAGGGKLGWKRLMGKNKLNPQKIELDLGTITESGFLKAAERYLGKDYVVHPGGRYVSKDGLRQIRYGNHETRNPKDHHAHFEAYDKKGGKLEEKGRVEVIND